MLLVDNLKFAKKNNSTYRYMSRDRKDVSTSINYITQVTEERMYESEEKNIYKYLSGKANIIRKINVEIK